MVERGGWRTTVVGGGHNGAKATNGDPWCEVWNPPCRCAAWTYEGEERRKVAERRAKAYGLLVPPLSLASNCIL